MKTSVVLSSLLVACLMVSPAFGQSGLKTIFWREFKEELGKYLKNKVKKEVRDRILDGLLVDREFVDRIEKGWKVYSCLKNPKLDCIVGIIIDGEVLGPFVDEAITDRVQKEHEVACLEFLPIAFPKWEEERLRVAKELKVLTETAKTLKENETKIGKKLKAFNDFKKREEQGLATERTNIGASERALDSLNQEREALKNEVAAFDRSEIARNYKGFMEQMTGHFQQVINGYPPLGIPPSPPKDVASAKMHLDHLLRTGELAPDRPSYVTGPIDANTGRPAMNPDAYWKEIVLKPFNKAARDYKDAKMWLDDKAARLNTKVFLEKEKLKNLKAAYDRRLKGLQEKESALKPALRGLTDESALKDERTELNLKRKKLNDDVVSLRAVDWLLFRCISVREKPEFGRPQGEPNWSAEYYRVLAETSIIPPGHFPDAGVLVIQPRNPFGQSGQQVLSPGNPFGGTGESSGPAVLSPGNPFGGTGESSGPAPRNPFEVP